MAISEHVFTETIARWADDVQREALALFQRGVAHDSCIRIAIQIVEGRDIERARTLAKLTGVAPQRLS